MTDLVSRLMPLDEVAHALGVSIYSIRRFISADVLKCVRVGGRVMVATEEVMRAQKHGVATPRLGRPRKGEQPKKRSSARKHCSNGPGA